MIRTLFMLAGCVWWMLIFLPFIQLSAQSFSPHLFTAYTVNDGLPQSSVYVIFQDSRGYMWFGTGNGLCRFNGYSFKVFKHDPGDSLSISANAIRGIIEDDAGYLWIGTDLGLNRYDPLSGSFDRVTAKTAFADKNVVPFAWHDGRIWFRHLHGFCAYDPEDHTFHELLHNENMMLEGNPACVIDRNILWFLSGTAGLVALDIADSSTHSFQLPESMQQGLPLYLHPLANHKLFLANSRGAAVFDKLSASFQLFSLNPGIYSAFRLLNPNQFWYSVKNEGIFIHSLQNQPLMAFDGAGIAGSRDDQPFEWIYDFSKDRQGNIWISAEGRGLYCYSAGLNKFDLYHHDPASGINLKSDFIRGFCEAPDGDIYVGTLSGLHRMDHETKQVGPVSGFQDEISCLFHDEKFLFIGTGGKIIILDLHQQLIQELACPESPEISRIHKISKGPGADHYLVGSSRGLLLLKQESNGKWSLELSKLNYRPAVFDFVVRKDGGIWASTINGVQIYNPEITERRDSLLPGMKVNTFQMLNNGRILMGTASGLYIADPESHEVEPFKCNGGNLADDFIYGILPGAGQELWISTNKGISKILPDADTVINYRVEDGLQSNEFNSGAFFKASDGRLYFGGINGFNVFHPDSVMPNSVAPQLTLEGISLFEQPLKAQHLNAANAALKLNYDENTLTFTAAALDFGARKYLQYAFMLEGFEQSWNHTGNQHFIRYTNLPPGNYSLMGKAANPDGIWSAPVLLARIVISPPYWQTWWFLLLSISAMLALLVLVIQRVSTRKLRMKLERLQRQRELELLRSRISRDIHDDIGAGLSKIALLSDLAKQNGSHPSDNNNLKQLSSHARKMIDSLSEIIWAINPRNDDLASMLAYFRSYAADFLETAGLEYRFLFPSDIPETALPPDFRRNLFLILKESLNNTLKYAAASSVEIEFSLKGDVFVFRIADDGCGFPEGEVKGSGNGLRNMKVRAASIGAELKIMHDPGCGTEILVEGKIKDMLSHEMGMAKEKGKS